MAKAYLHATPVRNWLFPSSVMGLVALLLLLPTSDAMAEGEAIANIGGTLNSETPSILHQVTIPADGTMTIQVTTGPDLNLYGGVAVYDSDGSTSLYWKNQGPGTTENHVVTNLRAGSYTIKIEKDGRSFYFGAYSGAVSLTAVSLPNDSEPNDDTVSALNLSTNTSVTGHLGFRGQQQPVDLMDLYTFTLAEDGHVTLNVSASGDDETNPLRPSDGELNLYGGVALYDSDGENVIYWTNQGPATIVDHTVNALRKGTYYVKIEKDSRAFYWGSYTLEVIPQPFTRISDTEPNDDMANALPLPANELVSGSLGCRGQGLSSDTVDYWRYNHAGGNLEFTLHTSGGESDNDLVDGELNLYGGISLHKPDNEQLFWSNQGPGNTETYTVSDLEQGEYYFRVEKDGRAFYWGTYILIAQSEDGQIHNPDQDAGVEPGDDVDAGFEDGDTGAGETEADVSVQDDADSGLADGDAGDTDGSGSTACFIATAAYGSPFDTEVVHLRKFRDNVLNKHSIGRAFTWTYYRHSPPIAAWIANKPLVRASVRTVLLPTVLFSRLALKIGFIPASSMVLILNMLLVAGIVIIQRTSNNSCHCINKTSNK